MAHAAILDKLAESLVTATTARTAEYAAFKSLKQYTVKGLRDQSHARTNQFAVKDKLDGLTEKFAVLNREDLADALGSRLEELPTKSGWIPEILSLLLELSDQPARKTLLEDVQALDQSDNASPHLTWEEIIAEDPLDEEGIWDDIEGGYHSSGNELDSEDEVLDDPDPTISTQATSVDSGDLSSVVRLHLVQPNAKALSAIKDARAAWESGSEYRHGPVLSELTIIREMLSMYHGVPTDLFRLDAPLGKFSLSTRAKLATASSYSVLDVLQTSGRTSSALNFLRRWSRSTQSVKHLRTIQHAIGERLSAFDQQVTSIERRYIGCTNGTVVSIIDVHTAMERAAHALMHFSSVMQILSLSANPESQQLDLLDALYDEVGLAQVTDNWESFDVLADVFLASLRTYLRPLAIWIKTGMLASDDHAIPLVIDANSEFDRGRLWHGRFRMNKKRDGDAFIPRCLLPFATQMFALGKSRSFLNALQPGSDFLSDDVFGIVSCIPRFDDILQQLKDSPLISFPQLLHTSLERWVNDISTDCTPLLQSKLWSDHGLGRALDALPFVYLSKDGALFEAFAGTVVERMLQGEPTLWSDTFLLTELAQSKFGNLAQVDAEYLKIGAPEYLSKSVTDSVTRSLEQFKIECSFPWPVQNITRCSASAVYAKAFAFLLQIRFANSLLVDGFFDLRSQARSSPMIPLRQQLLCFVTIVWSYVTTISHSLHEDMRKKMAAGCDIDAMVAIYAEHEFEMQTSLLLSPNLASVRDAIIGILELGELLTKTTRPERIASLQDEFHKSHCFLITGIRGVSRAGGGSALETLAERLEWSVRLSEPKHRM